LIVANLNSNSLSLLLGRGDGTFQPARDITVARRPHSVIVGDFNGDGILDLAVANSSGTYPNPSTGEVLLGRGDGQFQPPQGFEVGVSSRFVVAGDFNGDGIPDLAVANYNSDDLSILLGRGDGTFRWGQTIPVGIRPVSITAADFNGDNR